MMKLINLPKQSPSAKISKEILDAFIEEVDKIQEEISSHFELWKNDSSNLHALKTVQRGFHTLRGNGYLVGASVIGELGWQCENLFNQIMEQNIERNEMLFSLIEKVQKILPDMMEQFQQDQSVPYEVTLLISQISHFIKTKGHELGEFESPRDVFIQHLTHLRTTLERHEKQFPLPLDPEVVKIFRTLEEDLQELGMSSLLEIITLLGNYGRVLLEKETPLTQEKLALFYKAVGFIERLLTGKNFDQEEQQTLLDTTKVALSMEEHSAYPIFFHEAKQHLEDLQSLINQWHVPFHTEIINALREKWQILKNHAHREGIMDIEELCHHLEFMLNLPEEGMPSHQELKKIMQRSIDELTARLETLRSGGTIEIPQQLITPLHQYQPKQSLVTKNEVYEEEIFHNHEWDELVKVKLTLVQSLTDLAKKLTHYRVHLEQQQAVVKNNLVEMEQIITRLRDQSQHLKIETQLLSYYRWINKVNDEELEPLKLNRFPLIQQLSDYFMESVNTLVNLQDALKILAEQTDILLVQQTRMSAELQDTMHAIHKVPFWNILPALQKLIRLLTKEFCSQIDFVVQGTHLKFERNLLHTLLTLLEFLLRNLISYESEFINQEEPSLQRITIEITQGETEFIIKVNNKDARIDVQGLRKRAEKIEIIQPHMDDQAVIQLLLEPSLNKRKRSMGLDGIKDYIQSIGGTFRIHFQLEKGSTFEIHLPQQIPVRYYPEVSRKEECIEVETVLIDKLTDLTETLSASRIDMEQQQRTVKNKLQQMEQTTNQLRDQLHRLKMEIQAQFTSPMNQQETELQELTRFPLIQQLSRHLLEELNHLGDVYAFLKMILRQMGKLLVHQTHVSTGLHIAIMQTHMIPFSKMTVRLQKVVNFTAQKLNKKINFTIRGDHVEFERALLTHLIRPIEMMLKNAMAYGIEETEVRQQLGKPTTAQLLLEIIQTESAIMIKMSDDGSGLDPGAIHKKAEELQLIQFNTFISNQAVMRFVLEPSFQVERCKGMDKINREIEHLGGFLSVYSNLDEGVTFEIRFNQALVNPTFFKG